MPKDVNTCPTFQSQLLTELDLDFSLPKASCLTFPAKLSFPRVRQFLKDL